MLKPTSAPRATMNPSWRLAYRTSGLQGELLALRARAGPSSHEAWMLLSSTTVVFLAMFVVCGAPLLIRDPNPGIARAYLALALGVYGVAFFVSGYMGAHTQLTDRGRENAAIGERYVQLSTGNHHVGSRYGEQFDMCVSHVWSAQLEVRRQWHPTAQARVFFPLTLPPWDLYKEVIRWLLLLLPLLLLGIAAAYSQRRQRPLCESLYRSVFESASVGAGMVFWTLLAYAATSGWWHPSQPEMDAQLSLLYPRVLECFELVAGVVASPETLETAIDLYREDWLAGR